MILRCPSCRANIAAPDIAMTTPTEVTCPRCDAVLAVTIVLMKLSPRSYPKGTRV